MGFYRFRYWEEDIKEKETLIDIKRMKQCIDKFEQPKALTLRKYAKFLTNPKDMIRYSPKF